MSEQTIISPIVVTAEDKAHVKKIWKAFWILLILTVIELALGLAIYFIDMTPNASYGLILAIKGTICILTLAKAFYIISIFMHLGDELRQMIMTIALPATLFIWFIVAFIWDGNSYKNLRNTDGGSRVYIEKVHNPVIVPLPVEKTNTKLD